MRGRDEREKNREIQALTSIDHVWPTEQYAREADPEDASDSCLLLLG